MTVRSRPNPSTRVYLEVGRKRAFACALDWPGWCRSGKDEEQALAALAASAPRYAAVAAAAGVRFPKNAAQRFDVVERLPGSATTDFGAPDKVARGDSDPLTKRDTSRLARLVAAAWTILDRTAAGAPAALRKGPRGGGRDRDAVVEHVVSAEASYARKLGIRLRVPKPGDETALRELRNAIVAALRTASGPPLVERGWPPRYVARRMAWHVLDHAWEIEDRSEPRPAAD
jgi:hypothetical protein